MNAFIDTSSLFKKYINEENSESFEKIIQKLDEIILSPTTLIELHKSIQNRLKSKCISREEGKNLIGEINRDYPFFDIVGWDSALEKTAVYVVNKYNLKTLDSIQLASGIISKPDQFITSDLQLSKIAKKEIKKVVFL